MTTQTIILMLLCLSFQPDQTLFFANSWKVMLLEVWLLDEADEAQQSEQRTKLLESQLKTISNS